MPIYWKVFYTTSLAEQVMELKILDLNLWLLPAPAASDQKNRLNQFIALVNKTDPDIITLQEVWLKKYITFIRKNLDGYHIHHPSHGAFNKSGLVTLSKKKQSSFYFHRFPKLKGEIRLEKLAGKGYLMIKLRFAGRNFHIVNTHLYCEKPGSRKRITEQQLGMLIRLSNKGNWIICGDLNLGEKEFNELNQGHFTHHTSKVFTYAKANKYARQRFNKFGIKNRKIDYTLLKAKNNNIIMHTTVLKKPLVSDHYAVLTTFTAQGS